MRCSGLNMNDTSVRGSRRGEGSERRRSERRGRAEKREGEK